MNTIFMSSENSKTSDPHRLWLNLTETPEAMKLLGYTTSKTTKNENGENVPLLEITEVVLLVCNVVNNSYQQKKE